MKLVQKWVLSLTVGCFLGAQAITEDPVMKARLQRAQAQGIEESDLPPVPRGVVEPPPLPPPEIHTKDLPHPKVARSSRRHGARAGRAGKADPAAPQARAGRRARTAPPAGEARQGKRVRSAGKVARKNGRRVKA